MTIEKALRDLLKDDAAVSGVVGAKIYPLLAPQNIAAPFIVYTRVIGDRIREINGPSGMAQVTFQIDCYAGGLNKRNEYPAAVDLANKVRLLLDGYEGTKSGIRIGGISLQTDQDFYEPDTNLYRVSQDYLVTHDEAIS